MGWKAWQPALVEPPKPVVKKWEVTTETRPVKWGDVYLRPGKPTPALGATFTHRDDAPQPIVTAVKPLEPPRIKTVWRAPKEGEQYIPFTHDGLRTASCDWGSTSAQVLVVE